MRIIFATGNAGKMREIREIMADMDMEICSMKAISFTNELPVQTDEGYTANLRNDHYLEIGLPSDDEARIPPARLGYGAGGTAA